MSIVEGKKWRGWQLLFVLLLAVWLIIGVSSAAIGTTWNQSNSSASAFSGYWDENYNPIATPDFNATEPWASMGRVTIDGNVMAQVRKHYYKTENVTVGGMHWMNFSISDVPAPGYTVDPWHVVNGTEVPWAYIGAYEGSVLYANGTQNTGDFGGVNVSTDRLVSVAGVKPATGANNSITLPNFRAMAQKGGVGWELQSFGSVSVIQRMYIIEHRNWNSQSVIGTGVTQITDDGATNMAIPTGLTAGSGTNSIDCGNYTCSVATVHYSTGQNTNQISYRGVEALYGNIWEWVDFINIKADRNPWVANYGAASDVFSGSYSNTGLSLPPASGYGSDLSYSAGFDYSFLPSAVAGSSSTYITDYYYQATGNRAVRHGGYWSSAKAVGAFVWHLSDAASAATRGVSARAAFTPPVVANFTHTNTSAEFAFTDESFTISTITGLSGTPSSWNWSFGDGSISTEQNPTHTYAAAGTYNANLTVSDGTNYATSIQQVDLFPLVAAFSGTPTSGFAPLTVQFTDGSANYPTAWFWDFGDGDSTNSTVQNPVHTYLTNGTKTVSLNASNDYGFDIETKTAYIDVIVNPPTPNFSANVTSGIEPLPVKFTDESIGSIDFYDWEFGDGNRSTEQSPEYLYPSSGRYTVNLTVGNTGGNSTISKTDYIEVHLTPPIVDFEANKTVASTEDVIGFLDLSSDTPTEWDWSFGDGSWQNGTIQNPDHIYTSAGVYTVKLIVTNGGETGLGTTNSTEKIDYIDIGLKPVANFTQDTTSGAFPLTVVFTDTSENTPTMWLWDFGDGDLTNSTEQNPVHTYADAGLYSVNLTASNYYGNSSLVKPDLIGVSSPIFTDFEGTPTIGQFDLTVAFTDTSVNATAWSWDFGDGSTSTLQNPDHTYLSTGNYTVSLNASNAYSSNTTTKTDYISVGDKTVVDFSGTPRNGQIPLSVSFTDLSTNASVWLWDFGDGNTTGNTERNPVHLYTAIGTYEVSLQANNTYGGSVETKPAYIVVSDATVANFTYSPHYGATPLLVTFTDTSTGSDISSWHWDFGDGNTSVLQSPTHTYDFDGVFQVNLTVSNLGGSSTKLQNVTVATFSSEYTGTPTVGPSPLSVSFTEIVHGLDADSYYWEFGDGNTSALQNPTNLYPSPGYYTVRNRVMNGSTEYWLNKTNYIEAYGIVPSFTVSNTTSYDDPLVVQFTDTSTNVNATPSSYYYVFGDGSSSTEQNPIHTYTTYGVFEANLTVSNATQGVSSTTGLTSLSRLSTNTVSSISYNWVMNAIYPTTIMVKDSQTLALIGGTSVTVSGSTYILDNGILSNYFEYGPHTFFVEAEGYSSKTTSLFVVGNSTFTILLDPISGASQTTWWTPHTVQITVMSDAYGTRLPNVLVEAYYNESAMPTAWIETLYGIQSTAAGQMLNQSLTLGGTTGSDGTLTTSMLGSLKYDIYLTSEEYGLNNYHVATYPSDSMLNIYVPITDQTLPTSGNSTYVYLNNTRLYITQPNISYVSMCIDYQDLSGTTSAVSELWWFGNNNSIFGAESFVNPGMSLVTNCKTLYNVRGTPVYWNYSAVTDI